MLAAQNVEVEIRGSCESAPATWSPPPFPRSGCAFPMARHCGSTRRARPMATPPPPRIQAKSALDRWHGRGHANADRQLLEITEPSHFNCLAVTNWEGQSY